MEKVRKMAVLGACLLIGSCGESADGEDPSSSEAIDAIVAYFENDLGRIRVSKLTDTRPHRELANRSDIHGAPSHVISSCHTYAVEDEYVVRLW